MKRSYGFLAITCLVAVLTACLLLTPGYAADEGTLPPTQDPVDVNPADLPDKFGKLEMSMDKEAVKAILGYPVTIRPMPDGVREWKYFLPGGTARLFINFKGEQIISIQQLTP